MRTAFWTRLVLLLGLLKLVGVVVASLQLGKPLPAGLANPYDIPPFINYLWVAVYGAVGIFLLIAGRGDERAISLGGFFLLIADSFCARFIHLLAAADSDILRSAGLVFRGIRPEILMPFFFWRFARDFPRSPTPSRIKQIFAAGVAVSAAAGTLLFLLNLIHDLMVSAPVPAPARGTLHPLPPAFGAGLYWLVMIGLLAPVLPLAAVKARYAVGEERRRVRLFTAWLVLGLAPITIEMLCELLLPSYTAAVASHHEISRPLGIVCSLFALSVPVSTSYAVLVHRVLEVKLIARRALHYALARYSALALAAVPLVAILIYLYGHREESLAQLFSGSRMPLLLAGWGLGLLALNYRRRLLDAIDRRFFREQYDARQILTRLVDRIRATYEGGALAKLIAREVDLALHLDSIALLVVDPRSGMLLDPGDRGRRLDASSSLASLVGSGSEPLAADLEDPRSPLARLPQKERHWLVDSGFRLLAPILARDGSLLGMICLGEKKSGLPFLKEDRALLHAIACNAAWVLELEQSRTHNTPRRVTDETPQVDDLPPIESPLPAAEVAKECTACGTLYQPYTVFCSACSRRLEPSHVPYVLPGRFRFECRIGSGGMGVVYRGADLALGRPVAVKTMRQVSPEDAMRLRREARTAAAVSHPHLASIYGIETWQGTPILILELLEGGTLAQRLEHVKLSPIAAVELGIAMAEALAQLHACDILHRDIKPSNIGYSRDGIPKLMDFGIARVMFDLRRDSYSDSSAVLDDTASPQPTWVWNQTPTSLDLSRQLAGTLSYLSPEALNGQRAEASFDLWSLAIVLYECLLGRKVFGSGDARQVMTRIRLGRVPDFAQVCPEYDDGLRDFFRGALHKNATRRPGSALELKQQLLAVHRRLAV
ncbi:MAG TPA: protein kinase [Thermoanaerobaculia bacterium]|nr:protein kinase [Thermoanaerobaculia bacterium]